MFQIISNRDPRFTSRFWVPLSIRKQMVLEDMLRCSIIEFKGSWEKYLPLAESTYNNSYQASINMAPYEALYGHKCRSPLYWSKLNEEKLTRVDLLQEIEEKVRIIRDNLKAASNRQKSYIDLKRRNIEFSVGKKSCPGRNCYDLAEKGSLVLNLGPYEVLERIGLVAYCLPLPP
ncbi:integrase [Gossypium australe]|uniref:Integrase n=1 Tax=Gossypium australe TaxID=47621 RepID=A0A5B6WHV2_9ROSI|nr:integrase [Gossypium australe]